MERFISNIIISISLNKGIKNVKISEKIDEYIDIEVQVLRECLEGISESNAWKSNRNLTLTRTDHRHLRLFQYRATIHTALFSHTCIYMIIDVQCVHNILVYIQDDPI